MCLLSQRRKRDLSGPHRMSSETFSNLANFLFSSSVRGSGTLKFAFRNAASGPHST